MALQATSIVVIATYPFMTYLSGVNLSFALCAAAMIKSTLSVSIIPSFFHAQITT